MYETKAYQSILEDEEIKKIVKKIKKKNKTAYPELIIDELLSYSIGEGGKFGLKIKPKYQKIFKKFCEINKVKVKTPLKNSLHRADSYYVGCVRWCIRDEGSETFYDTISEDEFQKRWKNVGNKNLEFEIM